MKKVLVSLLVLALAMTSVFAAVNFSGELVAGYEFNYNNNGSKEWGYHVMGQDGDDTNTTKLNLGFADDNGVWSVGVEGALIADGRVSGDIKVDMLKLFGVESNMSLTLGLAANDEQSVLRAYSNQSGNNFDRFRTNAAGLWASLDYKFGDLVEVMVAGSPATDAVSDGADLVGASATLDEYYVDKGDGKLVKYTEEEYNKLSKEEKDNLLPVTLDTTGKTTGWAAGGNDLVLSAKVTPISGVAVSGGWVLNGKDDDGTGTEGIAGGAFDVNVGELLGLGFDLGASATYKYGFANKQNVFAATVYGGIDLVDVAVEYSFSGADDLTHYLYAGVNLNVIENMLLDVYFGANDLNAFADSYFVGGDIGYTLSGVTFQLGIEYAAAVEGNASYNYDYNGLCIVPKVSVAF